MEGEPAQSLAVHMEANYQDEQIRKPKESEAQILARETEHKPGLENTQTTSNKLNGKFMSSELPLHTHFH